MHERHPRYEEALPAEPLTSETASVYPTKTERQRDVLGILEAGIDSILDSDGFARYLKFLSAFHEYSANNTLLIMMQRPDATRVASYDKWQALNRQVMKGEKGIKIYFPMFRVGEDPITGEEVRNLVGFGIGNTFDISQTEGDPLPEPPGIADLDEPDQIAEEVNKRASWWGIDREGLRLESKEIHGHARGYYVPTAEPKTIVVRRDIDVDEDTGEITIVDPLSIGKTKTLIHELAHYVADHRGTLPKSDAETVAESSAFVVLHRFGIDTGRYSFPYIAAWGKDKDVFRRNIGEIQKVSHHLIAAIEGTTYPSAGEGLSL